MNKNDIRIINVLKKYKLYSLTRKCLTLKDKGFLNILKEKKQNRTKTKSQLFSFGKKDLYILYNDEKELTEIKSSIKFTNFLKKYKLNAKYAKVLNFYKNDYMNKISIYDLVTQFRYKSFVYYCKRPKFDLNLVYNCIFCSNIVEFENKLETSGILKLFANYCNINNVAVRTSTFYDFKGLNYFSGGAERYLIDLHEIFAKRGINMDVYQDADIPFFRKYRDLNIIGLPIKEYSMDWSEEYKSARALNYIKVANVPNQLHIYSAFYEAYPQALSPSIGISHGVAWDNESNRFTNGLNFEVEKKMIIQGAEMCDRLVSVDNNTANWFQTLDYDIGARRFEVIPNYVDINEFKPRDNYLDESNKIIITYPRRLYRARGLYTLLNITDRLIEKHDNIEIHFVGKGVEKDLKEVYEKVEKYPGRVFCYSKDPKQMYEVYRNSDISLIPTMYSEGTSLSCLEAMSSGNIVISTRIGGLTDLIIDGYNGYLIEPNENALFEAIDDAVSNYKNRIIMKTRARDVAMAFNKDKWKEKWNKVFDEFDLTNKDSRNTELVEFFLDDFDNMDKKIFDKLASALLDNKLIYVRVADENKVNAYNSKYSGEMLQFIKSNEEITTNNHKIYVDKSIEKKVDIKDKYTAI